ncbi:MAG TPA: hypothetical protein PK156_39945, partial [Polyangium sp.]|nr:hypothetical protein [Polyangium sp.]
LSNFCADGVCCNNICMGSCQACSAAKKGGGQDGVCGSIKAATDPDNECSNGECNGSGACTTNPQPTFPNGTACTSAAQCASGFCADGVCCDSWCLGTCQACTAAKKNQGADGSCGPIANDKDPDEECWGGACNGANVCKQYNGVPCTDKSQCLSNFCVDGFCCGNLCTQMCYACSTAKKGQGDNGFCGPIIAGRDLENECNPGECNGSGVCNQPQTPQANGTTCVSGGQCASGNCVDGVCCDTACASTCMACTAAKKGNGADGTCGKMSSGRDPDLECNGGMCDGNAACRFYNGAPCSSANQCFSNYCVDGVCCGNICVGGCQACSTAKKGGGYDGVCENILNSRDPDNECNPGACNGAGACNQPQTVQANGTACTSATQCSSGFCIDGVCCDNLCAASCQACSTAKKGQGANGVCGSIINGSDPDNECPYGECNGSAVCTVSSNLPNGMTCTLNAQCVSGNCVDGICCNTACTGVCVACSATKKGQGTDGVCGSIKYDFDPDDECYGGACNGQNSCAYYNGVPCAGTTQCLSNYCVDGVCCNNYCGGTCYACSAAKKGGGYDGACGFIKTNTDPDNDCNPGVCNGSGICVAPTCTSTAECGTNATCTNSACVCNAGYSGDGYACTDIDECQTNNGGCDVNATCTNTPGSRTCACNQGYVGDGITCTISGQTLSVTAGFAAACALGGDHRGKCWGDSDFGELGLGDRADRGDNPNEMGMFLPYLDFGTGRTATQLSIGGVHACAILDNGSLKCWGGNSSGELGIGTQDNMGDGPNEMGDFLPSIDLGTGKSPTRVYASAGIFTCALLNDASVKCWGSSDRGQLGQGDTVNRGDNPGEMGDNLPAINLGTGRTAIAVAAGGDHACAILDNGTLKCWGHSLWGQCGWGDTSKRGDNPGEMGDDLPIVDVGTGKTVTAVAAGRLHTCAILNDGSVKCWGYNTDGQLGLGDTINRGDNPGEMGDNLPIVQLGMGKTAVAVTVGTYHSCALLNDSSVKCWGRSYAGQLGQGDIAYHGIGPNEMGDNLPAINLGTGKTVVALTTGDSFNCALLNDGKFKCWGRNLDGELGQGDTVTRGDGPGEMGDSLPYVEVF